MVPLPSDPSDDVFPGAFRPHLLPNGSFPYDVGWATARVLGSCVCWLVALAR